MGAVRERDIVYVLRESIFSDELIYSLRSIERNFPPGRVVFYGGQPKGLKPDLAKPYKQKGATKWARVRNTLLEICRDDDITDDFWLMNDDFFVMKKVKDVPYMADGSLWYKVGYIKHMNHELESRYARQLQDTARTLKEAGYDRLNYALHVPMMINKAKALKTLEAFPDCPMFRSLYGNMHKVGGVLMPDVKVQSMTEIPTGKEVFLSTKDESFRAGEVGKYIRAAFPEKSRWER